MSEAEETVRRLEDAPRRPWHCFTRVSDNTHAAGPDDLADKAFWRLTPELRGAAKRHPLERIVRPQH